MAAGYGALDTVLAPHSGQNLEPPGIVAAQLGHLDIIPARAFDAGVPRLGSRRINTTAIIQTPTMSKIQVTKPMIPAIKKRESKPLNPESSEPNGLLELLPPFPFPLLPLPPPFPLEGVTWRFWLALSR